MDVLFMLETWKLQVYTCGQKGLSGLQLGSDPFGAPTSFSPQASAGQFIVTPSMVIPEADWEAAFASPAPAAPKPAEPPQTQVNHRTSGTVSFMYTSVFRSISGSLCFRSTNVE